MNTLRNVYGSYMIDDRMKMGGWIGLLLEFYLTACPFGETLKDLETGFLLIHDRIIYVAN